MKQRTQTRKPRLGQASHIGLFRAPTANLNNFAGLDFLDGQDQGWKVLAQVFQAIGG